MTKQTTKSKSIFCSVHLFAQCTESPEHERFILRPWYLCELIPRYHHVDQYLFGTHAGTRSPPPKWVAWICSPQGIATKPASVAILNKAVCKNSNECSECHSAYCLSTSIVIRNSIKLSRIIWDHLRSSCSIWNWILEDHLRSPLIILG